MASKYEGLKGRIPEEEQPASDRDVVIATEMAEYGSKSLLELTDAFNRVGEQITEKAAEKKVLDLRQEAIDILIRKTIDAQGADKVGMHGFTWSIKYEPYPVADDPSAAIEYFGGNGMEHLLTLKASEVATRLKNYVKEEALNNELEIVEKVGTTPDGEPMTTTEVRSKIPGVKVYLKPSLSRVKSTATKIGARIA